MRELEKNNLYDLISRYHESGLYLTREQLLDLARDLGVYSSDLRSKSRDLIFNAIYERAGPERLAERIIKIAEEQLKRAQDTGYRGEWIEKINKTITTLRQKYGLRALIKLLEKPVEVSPKVIPEVKPPEYTPKYVGLCLADVIKIARLDPEMVKKYGRELDKVFEERIWQLFRLLNFEVEELGHKIPRGRVPDGIAFARELKVGKQYAILFDCKATSRAYTLAAEDERAIREYIEHYADQVERKGAKLSIFLLIAPEFAGDVKTKLSKIAHDTNVFTAHITVSDFLYLLDEVHRYRTQGKKISQEVLKQLFGRLGDRISREDIDKTLRELA